MIVRSIDKIINKTAEDLEISPNTVSMIMKYYFWWIFQKLESFERPTITIPNIGTLYPAKANFKAALISFIKNIRTKENKEYYKHYFRNLWKVRHKVYDYYEMKKTKTSKKYVKVRKPSSFRL